MIIVKEAEIAIRLTEPKGITKKILCVIQVPDGTVNCMGDISGLKEDLLERRDSTKIWGIPCKCRRTEVLSKRVIASSYSLEMFLKISYFCCLHDVPVIYPQNVKYIDLLAWLVNESRISLCSSGHFTWPKATALFSMNSR